MSPRAMLTAVDSGLSKGFGVQRMGLWVTVAVEVDWRYPKTPVQVYEIYIATDADVLNVEGP